MIKIKKYLLTLLLAVCICSNLNNSSLPSTYQLEQHTNTGSLPHF